MIRAARVLCRQRAAVTTPAALHAFGIICTADMSGCGLLPWAGTKHRWLHIGVMAALLAGLLAANP